MMNQEIKILSVSKQKKKYKVETREETFLFHEDTILRHMITPNRVFQKNEFDKILSEEMINEYLAKVLNFLSFKSRSKAEIYQYLKKYNIDEEKIMNIMGKLSLLGYLDDQRFASGMLDYVIRQKKGPRILELKLKEKKVEEGIITEFKNMYDSSLQTEVVKELINKALEKTSLGTIKKQKLKLQNKLLRDGFSANIIIKSIAEVEFVDHSEDMIGSEIKKLILKYQKYDKKTTNQKIISSLLNKGYDYSLISKYVKNINHDIE